VRRDRPSNPCGRTRSMMNKIALLGAVAQAFVLQSRDRSLQTAPSGQVMLVSDRCYYIHNLKLRSLPFKECYVAKGRG
jgi:hypothetical protein